MRIRELVMVTGWLASAVASTSAATRSAPEKQTILVYDEAQVPPLMLRRAKDGAARILAAAGIQAQWLHRTPEPGECTKGLDRTMLVMHIAATRWGLEEAEATGIALLAPEGGIHFYVFYNAVKRLATVEVRPEVILAHAIAHEIGHLLLCLGEHTPIGMMQGHWSAQELHKAAMGLLVFTPEEAAKMRQEIRRRASAKLLARGL